jgi:ribosomal protein S18 acetylase RimI-like enzyme
LSRSAPATSSRPAGLEVPRGLSAAHLTEIASLEAACLASDGGRLKLEFPVLRARDPDVASDVLWRGAAGELLGFLGIYQNQPTEVEICGMVHPEHRRQQIFSRLLEAALAELRLRGNPRVLLIVDRSCEAGVGFATARGGVVDSSEYRMRQHEAPGLQGVHEELALRQATASRADLDFLRDCIRRGFHVPEEAIAADDWVARAKETLVIEQAGVPVGVMRVDRDLEASEAGIYGFVVLPELQGRGIGRGALSVITRAVRDEGIASVHLEVLVDNPAALHLYETCGFEASGIEDYYLIAL